MKYIINLLLIIMLISSVIHPQNVTKENIDKKSTNKTIAKEKKSSDKENKLSNNNNNVKKKVHPSKKKKEEKRNTTLWGVAVAFGATSLTFGFSALNWWTGHEESFAADNFNFWNRGWLNEDTYAGGHDKIGHAFSNYIFQHAYTGLFEWAGFKRITSIWLAAGMTAFSFNMIELFDGFTSYGWEYGDTVFNFGGQIFAILSQLYGIDDYVQFKMAWVFSPIYWREEDVPRYKVLEDYNGQRFFLAANTHTMFQKFNIKSHFWKYIQPAVFYESRGYRPYLPEEFEYLKERNVGGALIFDLAGLIKDYFPNSSLMRGFGSFFKFYQIPLMVAYGYDLNHNRWHYVDYSLKFESQFDYK